ncbi:MAG: serine--tRNA ligase, partial [Dokdonella sp.]
MLDPALLRGQLADTAQRLAARGFTLDTAALETIEARRKQVQIETQELQNQRNTHSKAIGMAKAKGEDTTAVMAAVAGIGDQLKANELQLAEIQARLADIALGIPNLPHESVPAGSDESGNLEQHR